jgi:phytoene desaturase
LKKIAVIGSGFAGLTSAIELSSKGYDVTIFEKNPTLGGRARKLEIDGFTFDMGPSWYWMPDVFDRFFARHGKKTSNYFKLNKLDPGFSIVFDKNDELVVPASFDELVNTFESIEKGGGEQLRKFMKKAKKKYEIGMADLVYKPSHSIFEFINFSVIKGLFHLSIFTSFSKYVRRYFTDSRLVKLMEFPVLFLGATPKNTPALYSLMNYTGLEVGTYYPDGGFFAVIQSFVDLAKEKNVQIRCNAEVSSINVVNGKSKSITVNSEDIPFDFVVASADYHHVDQNLLEKKYRNYSESYWNSREMAPSSLLFYVGIDKKLSNLNHHTLFFDEDFDEHAKEIYDNPSWPKKPLFYMSCSSISDDKVAPKGMENLVFLIPLAPGLEDSDEMREKYFHMILKRLKSLTGNDISENIVVKQSYCVKDFEKDYHAFKGNAYGLANTLRQTAILKPRLKNKKVNNLFYTGQLTVPGPGVPPSIISGQIVAEEVHKKLS